jgi:oxygen-independent coproporphyrinogen III oxidase
MAVGVYISVPFCRTKCSYCNFASGVFSSATFDRYVDRVCTDIQNAAATAAAMDAKVDVDVDSLYLGGGTPTILESHQLERLFVTIQQNFCLQNDAEITVECAPGTLTPAVLNLLLKCGVTRVSLGVQSFVDREAASVGRIHKRFTVLEDLAALRASGINDINIDLIAGLPHQTTETWRYSLQETLATGVPHVSVYMLEVDEDSRLGQEVMAGGAKYHAHFVPDDDLTAELYTEACRSFDEAGISQYEISNFARSGFESSHNMKYWTRQPYFGCGVDAHSMLPARTPDVDCIRFSSTDTLEGFIAGAPLVSSPISPQAALQESIFLGLRLNRGVDLAKLASKFGDRTVAEVAPVLEELVSLELLEIEDSTVRLTLRGRLLSNEVFQRFVGEASASVR